MRDAENIRALEEQAKPDLVGLICWERSPRFVSEVPAYLPQCKRVGVFVNPTLDEIEKRNKDFNFSYIQLHGSESPEFCQAVQQKTGLQIIKAISIYSKEDIALASKYEGFADLILFDTKCATIGGSGKQFNWDILSDYRSSLPFLLSGGIGPEDTERLKQFHHDKCIGFDINSRFELEPGIKDTDKIRTFIRNIRTSEQNKLPL